jgi:hypothetical protein
MIIQDVEKFKKWLLTNGAEILPPTNQWEVVRFKGSEVGVVYTSGKTSNMYTAEAVSAYVRNKKWDGRPINIGRKNDYKKEKVALLKRDGCKCFLCQEELGDDITVEHLIPLVSGGKNLLSNMVLAHEKCNHELGVKPLNEKVNMVIEYRLKYVTFCNQIQ